MPTTRLFSTSALAAAVLLSLVPVTWAAAAEASTAASAAALPVTVEQDNLWNLASRQPPVPGATRQQVMVALLRLNPQAFVQGNMHRLRRGVGLMAPSAQEIAAEDPARAEQIVQAHLSALEQGVAAPALPRLAGPAPRAAATPASKPTPAASASAAAVAPLAPPAIAPAPGRPPAAAASVTPAVPVNAPVTVPVTEPAAEQPGASAAASAAGAASAAVEVPAPVTPVVPQGPADSGAPSPVVRWLPYALAVALAGGAVLMWRRRRAREHFDESVISSFYDENGVRRPSRPKVIDVSQAGVETARTVETLQPAAELVRSGASSAMPLQQADDPYRETALKLEIARTCLEVGRAEAARLMLQVVRREGSAAQQLLAGDLLDRLAPA